MNFGVKSLKLPAAALTLLLTAGCSTSSGTTTPATEAATDDSEYVSSAAVERDQDKMICRRHKPTGSRLSERICMTARQWEQMADDSKQILDQARRAPKSGID